MGVRVSENGAYITYGPYQGGDELEFTEDPASATVSFDIFNYKVRNSELKHLPYDEVAYYNAPTGEEPDWCVVTTEGKIGDSIENLYFTFQSDMYAPAKSDVEDEVNHPKHYTGHKADLECITFTELLPSLASNAFKYVWRCDDKGNKTEDLEKARWYLNRVFSIGGREYVPGHGVRHLMSGIIEGSDFDDWHKSVLIKIVNGYYVDAYNDISDLIGLPRHITVVSTF